MALINKKLSSYGDLLSSDINETTKLVAISGAVKNNKNISIAELAKKLNIINAMQPLTVTAFTDLDRVDLEDGIYNVDGYRSGILMVAKSSHTVDDIVYKSVLQTYTDSGQIRTRRIEITTPQVYPTWDTRSINTSDNIINTDITTKDGSVFTTKNNVLIEL